MPNSNHSKNTPNTYDSGDMADAYLLAENDMQWMSVALADIKKRLKDLKTELRVEHVRGLFAFEHVLDMYEYLAEERLSSHSSMAEKYQAEWEEDKKAVTL